MGLVFQKTTYIEVCFKKLQTLGLIHFKKLQHSGNKEISRSNCVSDGADPPSADVAGGENCKKLQHLGLGF